MSDRHSMYGSFLRIRLYNLKQNIQCIESVKDVMKSLEYDFLSGDHNGERHAALRDYKQMVHEKYNGEQ